MSDASPADKVNIAKIATLAITGKNGKEIAQELGLNTSSVYRWMRTDDFSKACQSLADDAMKVAKDQLRADFAPLGKEVLRVVKARLAKDDLEAVKVWLKTMGMDQTQESKGDTSLTVILPGQKEEKEVISEEVY